LPQVTLEDKPTRGHHRCRVRSLCHALRGNREGSRWSRSRSGWARSVCANASGASPGNDIDVTVLRHLTDQD